MEKTRHTSPQNAVPRPIASSELLQGGKQIIIMHRGEQYLLRETSQGKLILTK